MHKVNNIVLFLWSRSWYSSLKGSDKELLREQARDRPPSAGFSHSINPEKLLTVEKENKQGVMLQSIDT